MAYLEMVPFLHLLYNFYLHVLPLKARAVRTNSEFIIHLQTCGTSLQSSFGPQLLSHHQRLYPCFWPTVRLLQPILSRFLLQVCQSDRKQSNKRDHRGTKSKEREQSRDGELPSTASQTVALDTAIQQKRREMYEVEECHYRGSKSIERERNRDDELPSAESQTEARDRAIQQKRREIDEVEECHYTNTLAPWQRGQI